MIQNENAIVEKEPKQIAIKQLNIGFCLLKILMCFLVICAHFYSLLPLIVRNACLCAVPVFLFLSFYFSYKIYEQKNNEKFWIKIKRFAFPFYFWGIFFSVLFLITDMFFNTNQIVSLKSVFWQLVTGDGNDINRPLWYLFDAILLLISLNLLFKIFSLRKITIVMIFLIIFSFFMQYSLINYKLCTNLVDGLRFPVGRIFEMLPYAALGILFAKYNLFSKIKNYLPKYVKIILFLIIVTLMIFSNFSGPNNHLHFYYAGISTLIFTIFILIYFYSLEFKRDYIKTIIETISKYILGIYCIHYPVGKILLIITQKNINTLFLCILIFFIGLLVSYILSKNKFIRKAVI